MKLLSLILMLFIYAFVYFFRRFERYIGVELQDSSGLSVRELGLISSALGGGYLIGRFLGGILSDRFNACYVFCSAIISLLVPVIFSTAATGFYVFLICFFATGFFSGLVFPSIVSIIIKTVPKEKFGSYYSLFSGLHGVVGVLAPLVFPLFSWDSWKASILIFSLLQSVLIVNVAVVFWFTDKDLLQKCNCVYSNKSAVKEKHEEKKATNSSDFTEVKLVVLSFGILGFANRLCRGSVDWFPIIERELFHPYLVSFQQASCMIGCFLSGPLSDVISRKFAQNSVFANPRVSFLLILAAVNGLFYMLMASFRSNIILVTSNLVFGLVTDSVYNVGGVAVVEMVHPSKAGLATSLVSVPNQLGVLVAGYPVAAVAESELIVALIYHLGAVFFKVFTCFRNF